MSAVFSMQNSNQKSPKPKIVTCQDLEFEFFMKFEISDIQRCSTPVIKDDDFEEADVHEELNRTKEHFRKLILSMALPSPTPTNHPSTPSSQGFPKCTTVAVMLNRLKAEIARQQTFASIYSGPISNSYAMRKRF